MSETPSVKKKGLQPKDLINIGIFTALYFIIIMAVAMLGYVPIFIPLLSVICPLIGGIPYMLYITKVRHFGMVFIMGTILGLLMGLGGMGVYAFITGPVCGLLADLVLRSGNYNSAGRAIISHGVLSVWLIGNYIPIVMNRASYFAGIASGYGQNMPTPSPATFLTGAFYLSLLLHVSQGVSELSSARNSSTSTLSEPASHNEKGAVPLNCR